MTTHGKAQDLSVKEERMEHRDVPSSCEPGPELPRIYPNIWDRREHWEHCVVIINY